MVYVVLCTCFMGILILCLTGLVIEHVHRYVKVLVTHSTLKLSTTP